MAKARNFLYITKHFQVLKVGDYFIEGVVRSVHENRVYNIHFYGKKHPKLIYTVPYIITKGKIRRGDIFIRSPF